MWNKKEDEAAGNYLDDFNMVHIFYSFNMILWCLHHSAMISAVKNLKGK
jgi:hypothetical protein